MDLEALVARRILEDRRVTVILPLRSLGNNDADPADLADDWLTAWAFARWKWGIGSGLIWE